MSKNITNTDLLIFSDHSWDELSSDEQTLLNKEAQIRRVYFIQEALLLKTILPNYELNKVQDLRIITPILPKQIHAENIIFVMRNLIDRLIAKENILSHASWYSGTEVLTYTDHLEAEDVTLAWKHPPFRHNPTVTNLDFSLSGVI